MSEYPKINSIYKRDDRGRFIDGAWSRDEFEFLCDKPWQWTEKVDGTNIRLYWTPGQTFGIEGPTEFIKGRTDRAQIPPKLLSALIAIYTTVPFPDVFADADSGVVLYGEGYGAGIQKGGGNYRPDPSFVLFDVKVGDWWLKRDAVKDIGEGLGVAVVPPALEGSIADAVKAVRDDEIPSGWSGIKRPEGVVGRPLVDLFNRRGERIITKIKAKDFA